MAFPKGNIPTAPIKKGQHLSPSTEFKKGIVPKNKLPVGTTTTRKHKRDSCPRGWIKVAEPNTWMPRAVWVWIRHGGTVPHGFVIHHINENPLDDQIDNLVLMTRAQHQNTHRGKMSTRGLVLQVKQVPCSNCGESHAAKANRKNGLCNQCKKIRNAENTRRYKQRVRLTN